MSAVSRTTEADKLLYVVPAQTIQASLPFIDVRAPHPNPNSYIANVLQSPTALYGVAMHGACGPGAFLLLAPAEKKEALRAFFNANGFSTGVFRSLTRGDVALLNDIAIIYPGDVVRFVQPMSMGVVAYTGHFYQSIPTVNEFFDSGVGNNRPALGPRPLVRWYTQDPGPQSRIQYFKTPAQFEHPISSSGAPAGDQGGATMLGPTVTSVTVEVKNNTYATEAQLTGAEECVFEVWWRMNNGLWVHNDADDWDDAGRGRANASHTAETYDVPRSAREIYLRRISTNVNPVAWLFAAED